MWREDVKETDDTSLVTWHQTAGQDRKYSLTTVKLKWNMFRFTLMDMYECINFKYKGWTSSSSRPGHVSFFIRRYRTDGGKGQCQRNLMFFLVMTSEQHVTAQTATNCWVFIVYYCLLMLTTTQQNVRSGHRREVITTTRVTCFHCFIHLLARSSTSWVTSREEAELHSVWQNRKNMKTCVRSQTAVEVIICLQGVWLCSPSPCLRSAGAWGIKSEQRGGGCGGGWCPGHRQRRHWGLMRASTRFTAH